MSGLSWSGPYEIDGEGFPCWPVGTRLLVEADVEYDDPDPEVGVNVCAYRLGKNLWITRQDTGERHNEIGWLRRGMPAELLRLVEDWAMERLDEDGPGDEPSPRQQQALRGAIHAARNRAL